VPVDFLVVYTGVYYTKFTAGVVGFIII